MAQQQARQKSESVTQVRYEHLRETTGIGTGRPRLSWQVETGAAGWQQAGYEIALYEPGQAAGSWERIASTGRVASSESVLVGWPFAPLGSRARAAVRVRAWGADGQELGWSALAPVETALLAPEEWTARFISPAWPAEAPPRRPASLLRREFELRARPARARLYLTALGVYEAQLNGQPVSDHVMAPGWTSYHHRLRYQTLDVTALLQAGRNALTAQLGDGWYRGRLGFGGGRANLYGERLALLAQLEVCYADGSVERLVTDDSWRAATGAILENDIYDGETYDARLEPPGWRAAGFDDRGWAGVEILAWDLGTLFAPLSPPVRRTQEVAPVAMLQSPSGRRIVDFGQNLVGRLRIRVQGPAGQQVTLRHAEVLEHGELGTRPLRHAKATDRYILKGEGIEVWEPCFTFHGFRYVEVDGWPGELRAEDLRAQVCHTDLERTGWFACSDEQINRLHENAVWSMRGNFLDIPTDCPQRDERLGWTGDIQVFSPTAAFLYDTAGFLSSWLRDLAAEQAERGGVPHVVPSVTAGANPPAAAWGDAAVVIPWVLYQRYGDVQILAEQFGSMRSWVDLIDRIAGAGRLWDTGFQFGDWLDPAAPPDNPGAARTPGFIVASAYYARSAELVGQAAEVLGESEAAEHYAQLAEAVRAAFNREYVTPSGRLLSDSSTAYALALQFDLLPSEAQRRRAGERLVELARGSGYRISTGFVGTPLICDALCSVGQSETAFRLLMTRENPSWLYPVSMGATTIWERWDSMLPDGTINPGEMTSFNHYALGAVADWLHRAIGGLIPVAAGYRRMEMRPRVGGGLRHGSAKHLTPYGLAACAWRVEDGQMEVEVEVPPNTTACVYLPGKAEEERVELGAGRYHWRYAYPDQPSQRLPLSLDSTIADLIDDPRAYPQVVAAVQPFGRKRVDQMLVDERATIRDAVSYQPHGAEMLASIERVLASLWSDF